MSTNGSSNAFHRKKVSEERRLKVTVERDTSGHEAIVLQDLNFNESVGWYAQKSLRLSPEEVDVLIRQLAAHRSTLRKRPRRPSAKKRSAKDSSSPTIVRFPTVDS